MVLPDGIDTASGLGAALEDLGLSAHSVVATGDAENDLALMRTCGCGVAVGATLAERREVLLRPDRGTVWRPPASWGSTRRGRRGAPPSRPAAPATPD